MPAFYDNVVHNGTELRTSESAITVFFAEVSGAGSFAGEGLVRMEGTYSPGNSPARGALDAPLEFGPDSQLILELGGITAGSQDDQLLPNRPVRLNGTLRVELIDGFVPAIDDRFELIRMSESFLSGNFCSRQFEDPAFGDDATFTPSIIRPNQVPYKTKNYVTYQPGAGPPDI